MTTESAVNVPVCFVVVVFFWLYVFLIYICFITEEYKMGAMLGEPGESEKTAKQDLFEEDERS